MKFGVYNTPLSSTSIFYALNIICITRQGLSLLQSAIMHCLKFTKIWLQLCKHVCWTHKTKFLSFTLVFVETRLAVNTLCASNLTLFQQRVMSSMQLFFPKSSERADIRFLGYHTKSPAVYPMLGLHILRLALNIIMTLRRQLWVLEACLFFSYY